jgi:hypothetical protein
VENLSLISHFTICAASRSKQPSAARRGQTLSKWEKGKVKKAHTLKLPIANWVSEWVVILTGQLLETWTRGAKCFFSLFYYNHRCVRTVVIHFALCAIHKTYFNLVTQKSGKANQRRCARRLRQLCGTNEVACCVVCRAHREKENTTHVTQLLFVLSI